MSDRRQTAEIFRTHSGKRVFKKLLGVLRRERLIWKKKKRVKTGRP